MSSPERAAREADGPGNFVDDLVRADVAQGEPLVTRFPPEPNGYLHIGHAKSICLNFGLAQTVRRRAATCASTTRTPRQEAEYVESIQDDVRWLGFDWGDARCTSRRTTSSKLYEFAEQLIERRQGVRRQPPARGDPADARRLLQAGEDEPVPRPHASPRTSISSAHARRRVRRRRARAAREDRHGVARREDARPGALPRSATRTTTAPATRGASTRCTTSRTGRATRSRA